MSITKDDVDRACREVISGKRVDFVQALAESQEFAAMTAAAIQTVVAHRGDIASWLSVLSGAFATGYQVALSNSEIAALDRIAELS